MKTFIAEIPGKALKTLLIKAKTRKEAYHKLKNMDEYYDDIEGIDVDFKQSGIGRIICEDKKKS